MKACGLSQSYLPDRRTFDRRLKTVSTDIKERISAMGHLFVSEDMVNPYILALGQVIYSKRGTSIEPLIEHIKSIFRIDPLPTQGYDKASAIVFLSVLLYQLLVYYNCKMERDSPRVIKYMIGC